MSTRNSFHDVHFYNASTGKYLGGCYQGGSITDANLNWILRNVLLIVEGHFTIRHGASCRVVIPSDSPVVPGDYDILSKSRITVSDEIWFARADSFSTSAQEEAFRTRVRNRDGKCVISGAINPLSQANMWPGFEAAHVFPRGLESLWTQCGYWHWITNMDDATGVSKIDSVQNGLLMSRNLHTCFDQYLFSANPDGGYKIVTFVPDAWGIDGRFLDPVCRSPGDINRVSDPLLRWHFRQNILANMRGAEEPVLESGFPPGTDKMATLQSEPYGKERFEAELQLRLVSKIREE